MLIPGKIPCTMIHRTPLALTSFCLTTLAAAQFPLLTTVNETIHPLYSLGSGIHYIQEFYPNEDQRTIYNLDMTPYRVLNYPAPPAGMGWSHMTYITEALFDTDPSTIEYVLVAVSPGSFGTYAMFIYREDGTLIFQQNPGCFTGQFGSPMDSYEPIYMVDGQAYMIVYDQILLSPPTKIYALPGSLPCWDCHGSPGMDTNVGTGPVTDMGSGIAVFPNPSANSVTVDLHGQRADAVLLHDAKGTLVRKITASGPHIILPIGGLAAGRYTVVVLRDGLQLAALPLMVEH